MSHDAKWKQYHLPLIINRIPTEKTLFWKCQWHWNIYPWTPSSLPNQSIPSTWQTVRLDTAARCILGIPSPQAPYSPIKGRKPQLVLGFYLQHHVRVLQGPFLSFFFHSFNRWKHHFLICIEEVCVLLSIYIQRSIFIFVLTKKENILNLKIS